MKVTKEVLEKILREEVSVDRPGQHRSPEEMLTHTLSFECPWCGEINEEKDWHMYAPDEQKISLFCTGKLLSKVERTYSGCGKPIYLYYWWNEQGEIKVIFVFKYDDNNEQLEIGGEWLNDDIFERHWGEGGLTLFEERIKTARRIEVARSKASEEGKEEFDIEKYANMRFGDDPEMLLYIKDSPREIERLEIQYYLRHPEFKTIAEFVNHKISDMGCA